MLEQSFLAGQKTEGLGWGQTKQYPVVCKSHHRWEGFRGVLLYPVPLGTPQQRGQGCHPPARRAGQGTTILGERSWAGLGFDPRWATSSTKYWLAHLAPVTPVALRGA